MKWIKASLVAAAALKRTETGELRAELVLVSPFHSVASCTKSWASACFCRPSFKMELLRIKPITATMQMATMINTINDHNLVAIFIPLSPIRRPVLLNNSIIAANLTFATIN